MITLEHVKAFEAKHGCTFKNSIVFFNTGWHKRWNEPEKYRNNLQFPTIDEQAARYLAEKGIHGLGIDTLSPDRPGEHFHVHDIVLQADKFIIENVTNLDRMPAIGATVFVVPMPFAGTTEAPARIIGVK